MGYRWVAKFCWPPELGPEGNVMGYLVQVKIIILAFCVCGVQGCSTANKLLDRFKTYSALESVTVVRESGTNNNQYVLVDIAFIYSAEINSLLLPKSAADWFEQKDIYLSMNRNGIEIVEHEPIPLGYTNDIALPKKKAKARRVVAYVAYYGKKEFFQIDLTHLENIQINIADKAPAVLEI